MDYVVVSTLVTDNITLADEQHIGNRMGGAGSYALCGIKLWTDSVVLVTGVGDDFSALYGSWFEDNGISMEGLMIKDAHTAISNVQYCMDGERKETPQYGAAHYLKMEAAPEEIARFVHRAKGLYVFKDNNKEYWDKILQLKRDNHFKLMWEINASCCEPSFRAGICEIARQVDIFSINQRELCALFDVDQWEDAMVQLSKWKISMLFIRLGARGAIIIHKDKKYVIPPAAGAVVEDVTGGGNSSSAGVLYGYCEGFDPCTCGLAGSVSAAFCIKQYGVPPIFSQQCRKEAEAYVKR